jgi:hypothetical protein
VASLYLEIDCVPTEEGAEHPFSYFKTELKENFGWKAVKITGSEEDEDED